MASGVSRTKYTQLCDELAGERTLRKGWEAECRRVLEQNRVLRRLIVTLANGSTLPSSAGAPDGWPSTAPFTRRPYPPLTESQGTMSGVEGHSTEGRRK